MAHPRAPSWRSRVTCPADRAPRTTTTAATRSPRRGHAPTRTRTPTASRLRSRSAPRSRTGPVARPRPRVPPPPLQRRHRPRTGCPTWRHTGTKVQILRMTAKRCRRSSADPPGRRPTRVHPSPRRLRCHRRPSPGLRRPRFHRSLRAATRIATGPRLRPGQTTRAGHPAGHRPTRLPPGTSGMPGPVARLPRTGSPGAPIARGRAGRLAATHTRARVSPAAPRTGSRAVVWTCRCQRVMPEARRPPPRTTSMTTGPARAPLPSAGPDREGSRRDPRPDERPPVRRS